MSGPLLHLAALAIGLVLLGLAAGLIYLVAKSGEYGMIAFYVVMGALSAYCFGRAAIAMLGWAQ